MAVIYETEKVSEVDAMVIGSNFESYRQVACAGIVSLYEELISLGDLKDLWKARARVFLSVSDHGWRATNRTQRRKCRA